MSRLSLIAFHVLLVLSILTDFTEAFTSSQLKVKLDHGGVLVGRHLTSLHGRHIRAFLSVPYAQPPVDELRFKAPVPYGSWDGERLAVKESNLCPQIRLMLGSKEFMGTEDCLYLDVYTPEEPQVNTSLPVMVSIHGGAFYFGGSRSYSGQYLLEKDVVFVSINYRIGPLGFFSTETLDCPGNNALKDQIAALEWIQKNIVAFGGDSNSVTIFGGSSGSASVTYHMISKKSQGLFQKAIAQSGTFYNPWAKPALPGVPAQNARKLAKVVGCDINTGNWTAILKCLRTKSAKNITEPFVDFFEWDIYSKVPFGPVIEPEHDDAFLTYSTIKEDSASVPLMIGFTSDDGLSRSVGIVNQDYLLEDIKRRFHKIFPLILGYHNNSQEQQTQITKAVVDYYFKDGLNFDKNNFQNFTDLISDVFIFSGTDEQIRHRMSVKNSTPTYFFIFDHKGSSSMTELFHGGEKYYGSCHGDEKKFLFPTPINLFISASPTKRERKLREAMIELWTNFASTSDPTPPGTKLPKWSPVTSYPPKSMRISSKDERDPILRMSEDYPLDRINFWRNI